MKFWILNQNVLKWFMQLTSTILLQYVCVEFLQTFSVHHANYNGDLEEREQNRGAHLS